MSAPVEQENTPLILGRSLNIKEQLVKVEDLLTIREKKNTNKFIRKVSYHFN